MDNALIGVDIGGTHITAAKVLPESFCIEIGSIRRCEVDSGASAENIISKWVEAISQLTSLEIDKNFKIGIAMPGPFDYEKGISYMKGMNKYESLYGLNIRNILAKEFDINPNSILFRNDAEAFLHGEVANKGVHKHCHSIGITLGTGLGSAHSFEGVTTDANLAFSPMYDGIAEDYISSRWFKKRFSELTGIAIKNVKSLIDLDTDENLKKQIFSEFGTNLGLFLRGFIENEGADEVIIGGNIAKCWDWFIDDLNKQVEHLKVVVKQTTLWEDAALVGAACSWIEAKQLAEDKIFKTQL